MGSNLARNLASREGNTVAIYNRSHAKTEHLIAAHPEAEFVPAPSYEEFAASLQKPRTAIIMVKAGAGTDAVIDALVDVFEPGDIIVDGGNALFTDTIRREKAVRETGINFVGAGISGGEEGALLGPSIMPGGSDESWVTLGPILSSIAAIAEGEPCVTHVGHDGAGPLREDGAQRHRVRRHAAHRRGVRPDPPRHRARPPPRSPTCSPNGTRANSSRTSSRSPPRCSARWMPPPASRSWTSSSTRPARRAPARGPCRPR